MFPMMVGTQAEGSKCCQCGRDIGGETGVDSFGESYCQSCWEENIKKSNINTKDVIKRSKNVWKI